MTNLQRFVTPDPRGLSGGDGPLVGLSAMAATPIRLPESSLFNHWLVLGRSGVGKSTLNKLLLAHKFQRKAEGKDHGAVVVVDTRGDLVPGILNLIPEEIKPKVRLVDFSRCDNQTKVNLVDPHLFPDRDRAVDTVVNAWKNLWRFSEGRWEDLLRNCLLLLYEFNATVADHPDQMLGVTDIPILLQEGELLSQDPESGTRENTMLDGVISHVSDPWVRSRFESHRNWDPLFRDGAVQMVCNRVNALASKKWAGSVLGPGQSTVALSDLLQDGLVVLVCADPRYIGRETASLVSAALVSLTESALRERGPGSNRERDQCLLFCDEFPAVSGPDWEFLLSDIGRYGCSLMLTAKSLAWEEPEGRRLWESLRSSVTCFAGFQMGADDARIIAPQFADHRVEELYLIHLDPYQCYVQFNANNRRYPVLPLKVLPLTDSTNDSGSANQMTVVGT